MRASTSLLVALGMILFAISIPGVAQAIDQTVLQFRSLEVGNVVPKEVCDRGWDFLGLGDRELPPDTILVMLDAELWASQTRAKDGKVINPEVRMVGTGQACGWISLSSVFLPVDPKQPLPSSPFYLESQIGDVFLPAGGECVGTSTTIPVYPLVLTSCNLLIPPDEGQGLLGGNASSNSVFNPLKLPGFQTGSFWTVRFYRETE